MGFPRDLCRYVMLIQIFQVFFAPRGAEELCIRSRKRNWLRVAESDPAVVRDRTLRCSGQLLFAVGGALSGRQAFREIISTQVATFSVPQMTQIRGKLQLSRYLATYQVAPEGFRKRIAGMH
jgi:hypothetical protein